MRGARSHLTTLRAFAPLRELFLLAGLLLSLPAEAHLLKVFAAAEGARVTGYAYFAGGARATGTTIEIHDPTGRLLATLQPDAEGAFAYTAGERTDLRITAIGGDGHRAEWTLRADELVSTLPTPAEPAPPLEATTEAPAPGAGSRDETTLAVMVEEAVARQVRPLREEIRTLEERTRLQDILGGIGYILGLAGLGLWWGARRPRARGRRDV